jgi:ribosomal-protein-serine acetyltransferase
MHSFGGKEPDMEFPTTIAAGPVTLRRWEPAFAEAGAEAVHESLAEFKPWLPWVHDDYGPADSAGYIAASAEKWATGEEFNYALITADGTLAGSIGAMTRLGPGVLELGYWTRTSCAGRGYMTAAVAAITPVALARPGIERVAIRYRPGNHASAAVAVRAGFGDPEPSGDLVIRYRHA